MAQKKRRNIMKNRIVSLLLALAQPALDRGGKDMDLWVLVDQSNSTAGIPAAGAEEIQAILERHKHAGDRVRLVDFAQSAVLRGRGDPVFAGGTAGTDMEQALAYTMALMSPNRTNRILMLTAGSSNPGFRWTTACPSPSGKRTSA